jgi:predicted PhzF superfamily epimerase YddE/YHI9
MVILTQMAQQHDAELSIRSRVFLPDAVAVEDPVVSQPILSRHGRAMLNPQTGSAHATLTGYYSTHPSPLSRLPASVQKNAASNFVINAQQLSQRGGGMKTRYEDGRAIITAKATEWARGSLIA